LEEPVPVVKRKVGKRKKKKKGREELTSVTTILRRQPLAANRDGGTGQSISPSYGKFGDRNEEKEGREEILVYISFPSP